MAGTFIARQTLLVAFAAMLLMTFTLHVTTAFAPTSTISSKSTTVTSSSALYASTAAKEMPDKVLLIGPGLLQLVVAKALRARGTDVLIVCPNDKKERFTDYIQNGLDEDADEAGAEIMAKALFGLPEESDPEGFGWREGITAVVVCAEDPVIGQGVIDTVMRWDGFGNDRNTMVDGPERAILCAPITSKVTKEKPMGWIPIFNNDKNEDKIWDSLVTDWSENPYVSGDKGNCKSSVIRFGSLLGGGVDGPMQLEPLGINERCYKMSLEQYRDLRERSFDRYRLAAQVLNGDAVNKKPDEQEEKEKNIKGQEKEAFQASMGYPEQDRTNRHTLAQAVCEALRRPVREQSAAATDDGSIPEEFTVLSKAISALPLEEEWDSMFANPQPAAWPDPANFVMPVIDQD
eukprot:CAMPEP_0178504040 /NCGR_PEP_ID=MMETSP0696-20121128/18371_1 /TAXON_ID=265572 /ORGANISM="Extubocellulus spinifer, Strain CCMP396" /LENGTH=403 /DNA_ID=CAMNT_0020133229 /DNA_START=204 /DNA_END=1415 /DNA_ORIENTATION=+